MQNKPLVQSSMMNVIYVLNSQSKYFDLQRYANNITNSPLIISNICFLLDASRLLESRDQRWFETTCLRGRRVKGVVMLRFTFITKK
jgi:hypothetical protein